MKVNNCDEVCFGDAIQGPPGKDGEDGNDGKDGKDAVIDIEEIRKIANSFETLPSEIENLNTVKEFYGWYFVSSVRDIENAPTDYNKSNYLIELISSANGAPQSIQRAWSLGNKAPLYRTSSNGAMWSNWKTYLE